MTAPAPRYPWQALLDVIGCDDQSVKSRLGLDHRQVARYRREGLTERRADELATTAGWPTLLIWPEMVDDALKQQWVQCADRARTELFLPYRANQIYHSKRCARRSRQRVYLAEKRKDPEFRAAETVRMRGYRSARAQRVTAEARRRRLGVQPRKVGRTHGVAATYKAGCGCEPCRLAARDKSREYQRTYRARRRAA